MEWSGLASRKMWNRAEMTDMVTPKGNDRRIGKGRKATFGCLVG